MVALSSSAHCGWEGGSYTALLGLTICLSHFLLPNVRGACFFVCAGQVTGCCCCCGGLQSAIFVVPVFVCSARVHRSIISQRHASLHLTHTHSQTIQRFACLFAALSAPSHPHPPLTQAATRTPYPRPFPTPAVKQWQQSSIVPFAIMCFIYGP